jgi:alginate O-acetyltransferase complex protein AlgI
VLLLLEKQIPALQKLPELLRRGYVLLAVVMTFVLFNADSLSRAVADLMAMFGLAGLPAVTGETLYYLKSFLMLYLAGIVGSTPLVKNAARWVYATRFGSILELIFLAGVLLVSTAYLVDGSFSPFLYFRF